MRVEAATLAHAERMAPNMRIEDRMEVAALGFDPGAGLRYALAGSFLAEAAVLGDDVAAMWGACAESLVGRKACLWMLGTDHVKRNPRLLLRGSRSFVARVRQTHPVVECYVDARYGATLRWLAHIGMCPVATVALNKYPFVVHRKEV